MGFVAVGLGGLPTALDRARHRSAAAQWSSWVRPGSRAARHHTPGAPRLPSVVTGGFSGGLTPLAPHTMHTTHTCRHAYITAANLICHETVDCPLLQGLLQIELKLGEHDRPGVIGVDLLEQPLRVFPWCHEQREKAPLPTEVRVGGRVMEAREEQPQKARSLILSTPSGTITWPSPSIG